MPTLNEIEVKVMGVDHSAGVALVRDVLGNEFEVDITLRRAGSGVPEAEERWRLERFMGTWVFDLQIGAVRIPRVNGAATGLHPVERQMLRAMHQHGLLYDLSVSPDLECD